MKVLNKIITGTFLGMILVGCSFNNGKDEVFRPIKNKKDVENEKVIKGKYDLDYSYFEKNGFPIPNNFKNNGTDYLTTRNETLNEYNYDFFHSYNEEKALKFYSDLKVKGYGDNSPYWRWKIELSEDEFFNAIKNNLPKVYNGRPKDVLTLSDGEWKSLVISESSIGKIESVNVAARGKSGIVTYLIINTTKNTYLVAKELNIRKLFAFNKYSVDSGRDVPLYGAKGGSNSYIQSPIRNNLTLLPSGYFSIKNLGDSVVIYGGGNGHGVGMSQYGAFDMAENYGVDYKTILYRSYPGSKISDASQIMGNEKNIKVGITTNNSLDHGETTLFSNGKMKISGNGFSIDVPAKQKIIVDNIGNTLNIKVNGKQRVKTSSTVEITAFGYYITIDGLRKAHTSSPKYRGEMILIPSKTNSRKIRIINRLKLEDYLKQVVVSEMPQSFGLEAMKAQAIAARTYAISDYINNRYRNDGFHVKDTTESQVYNNQVENDVATRAIEKTEGKILLYKGKPVDAKYFSTSSGFTETSGYVW